MYTIFMIILFCAGVGFGFLIGESITIRRMKKDTQLKMKRQYRKYK
jgi:hypothetical protein